MERIRRLSRLKEAAYKRPASHSTVSPFRSAATENRKPLDGLPVYSGTRIPACPAVRQPIGFIARQLMHMRRMHMGIFMISAYGCFTGPAPFLQDDNK